MTKLSDPNARLLACDFGTSGVTFGLYNPHSNAMEGFGGAEYEHMLALPEARWLEQDPREWIKAIGPAMAKLRKAVKFDGEDIVGIGVGGHMHALVVLDDAGQPLCIDGELVSGGIMWNDPRGEPEGCRLAEIFSEPIPARMTASRALWFAERHPQAWKQQVHRVAVPSTYIGLELTGQFGVGPGDASGMIGQLDAAGQMPVDKLRAVTPELAGRMPNVGRAGEVLGRLNARGADLLGLPAGIPVAFPEGDQPVGMVASGCVLPGQASISLGNSVVFNAVGTDAILSERGAIDSFRTATGDHLLMTCVTSGTIVFDEVVECFRPLWPDDQSTDALRDWLTGEAKSVPPGAGGVLALPYYLGEGVLREPNAFAAMLGLRAGSLRPGVLARASMEGTSLLMRFGYERMKQHGLTEVKQLVLSGGGSKSTLWPQIVADVFGIPVVKPQDADEAATRGAAYLALFMAQQLEGNTQPLDQLLSERVTVGESCTPIEAHKAVYDQMLEAMETSIEQNRPLYAHPWYSSKHEDA